MHSSLLLFKDQVHAGSVIVFAVAMHLAQRWVLLKHIMSKTEPLMAQLASMFIAAI